MKRDRRMSGVNSAGCDRLREGVPDGDGRYSALNQTACIRESMAHLTTKRRREFGAAREPNAGSATCNGGQYRPRKPNTPLRKEVEREASDPEGNLVIVERVARKRQHHFSCREYGWDGSAHILSRHRIHHTICHHPHRMAHRFDLQ